MRRLSFLRTTTVRLAAFYMALFLASTTAVLGVVYWFTAGFIERHTEQTIRQELGELRGAWLSRGNLGLMRLVSERSAVPRSTMLYAVATPMGDVIVGNLSRWPRGAEPGRVTAFEYHDRAADDAKPRPAIAVVIDLGAFGQLLVGHDMTERFLLRDQILTGFFWALFLAVVVGLAGAALMGRRVELRIEAINATIDNITRGAFADRMPVAGSGDEIDRLAQNMNRMLDEIGRLMTGLRQVTDNVAHDLRTPLARLRARLELAQADEALTEGQRATLDQAVAEIDRLLSVFNAILTIAAAESRRDRADFAPVDLGDLVEEVGELYAPVAESAGQHLSVLRGHAPPVPGSRQLLAQAITNLVENALKYAGSGGRIRLSVAPGPAGGTRLVVADDGPGIPAAERGRVLERFVRLEAHRGTPGHGLGLSLVAAVAHLHGAELRLEDNAPGLRVLLDFPPAPEGTPPGPQAPHAFV